VRNLNISNVQYGIQIAFSTYIIISLNSCKNIIYPAIRCYTSSNLIITNNLIKNNSRTGISISGDSISNKIEYNCIIQNMNGIEIGSKSSLNIIRFNSISGNQNYGVYLSGSKNEVSKNNFEQNKMGLFLDFSYNNLIANNNFIKNSKFHASYKVDYKKTQDNKWKRNYYDDAFLFLPKLIWGRVRTRYSWMDPSGDISYFYRNGINFDWFPRIIPFKIDTAQECDID